MPAAVHVQLQLRIVGDDGTVFSDGEYPGIWDSRATMTVRNGRDINSCVPRPVNRPRVLHALVHVTAAPPDRERVVGAVERVTLDDIKGRWCGEVRMTGLAGGRAAL
jgi:hypothetical protein